MKEENDRIETDIERGVNKMKLLYNISHIIRSFYIFSASLHHFFLHLPTTILYFSTTFLSLPQHVPDVSTKGNSPQLPSSSSLSPYFRLSNLLRYPLFIEMTLHELVYAEKYRTYVRKNFRKNSRRNIEYRID